MRAFIRLSVAALLLLGLSNFPQIVSADSLTADYQFQSTHSSTVIGAPDLSDLIAVGQTCGTYCNVFVSDTVDGNNRQVLQFPTDNGLSLAPTTSVLLNNGVYTIAILFKFSALGNLGVHWSRILDFKNGTNDNGFYVNKLNHKLQFFPYSEGTFVFTDNQYVQVVLTRDSLGTLTGYVNGVQQFSANDSLNQHGVIDGSNTLRFFQDNTSGGGTGEASPGSVSRIRIINKVLDPSLVLGLENNRVQGPTAASANISGQVVGQDGAPLSGVTMRLSGQRSATAITDNNGSYRFANENTDQFYTVTPSLANYHFSPANRSFSLLADKTDAIFAAAPDAVASMNAIDSNEYFVRQQYLDFLDREPDQGGFDYWTSQLNQCQGDVSCNRAKRVEVSAAFFQSQEFQETGSYIYRLYEGTLGRRLSYAEFAADRGQVVGSANLDASKTTFANTFVERPEFAQKYANNAAAESFVTALLQTLHDAAGVDLESERVNLINRYNTGLTMNQSRGLVVRALAENPAFVSATYSASFVQMEYYAYLRRDDDEEGFAFWLTVLNTRDAGNYRGMVCSFLTSAEYQQRFGPVVTDSNASCSNIR